MISFLVMYKRHARQAKERTRTKVGNNGKKQLPSRNKIKKQAKGEKQE